MMVETMLKVKVEKKEAYRHVASQKSSPANLCPDKASLYHNLYPGLCL